jgi:hypothetical protein
MAPEVEVGVPVTGAGGAPEVVDRDRVHAGGREALGQPAVEPEQTADVGQDHHRRAGRLRRPGIPGQQLVAVLGGQRDRLAGRQRAGPGR